MLDLCPYHLFICSSTVQSLTYQSPYRDGLQREIEQYIRVAGHARYSIPHSFFLMIQYTMPRSYMQHHWQRSTIIGSALSHSTSFVLIHSHSFTMFQRPCHNRYIISEHHTQLSYMTLYYDYHIGCSHKTIASMPCM